MQGPLKRRVMQSLAAIALFLAVGTEARAALAGPDFKIGPDVSLDSLSLVATPGNYLVVWRDLSGGSDAARIAGAFVGTTGIVSSSFFVSDAGGMPQGGPTQRPRVAFDGANFLVVWHDLRPNGTGVRGARVTQQGTVVGGADFLIAPAVNTQAVNPQTLFTGVDLFVAWQDAPLSGNGTQIFYTRVTLAGVPGAVNAVPAASGHDASQSLELVLQGPLAEMLIAYQDLGATPIATFAVRIAPDNSIANGLNGTQMFTRDFSPTGVSGPIGGTYYDTTDEYMLLASRGAQIDCIVSRAWLKSDDSVALSTTPLALVPQGFTGLDEDDLPRAYYNGANEFIFPRIGKVTDISSHVFIKRVATVPIAGTKLPAQKTAPANITDRDPNLQILDSATSGLMDGASAANIGSQYLVVWMDGRRRVADPPMQTNVYGALIDDMQPGNELRPYIRPAPFVGPVAGIAPLTCTFGFGNSTGIADSVHWDFGDGTTSDISANTHIYTSPGTYLTVYSLSKTGLNYNAFVQVFVQGNAVGGAGGPPQTVGGVLGPNSPGISSQVALESLAAKLSFTAQNTDSFHLTGLFNTSQIPLYLTGQTVTCTLGTLWFISELLAGGTFTSTTGSKPFITFQLDPGSGFFSLNGSAADLFTALAGTGVINATVKKQPVSIPLSLSFAGMSTTQTVSALYTATLSKSGNVGYQLAVTGAPGEGFFRIENGAATESLSNGKTGNKVDDFAVAGNLTQPGGKTLVIATSGNWTFTVGNYVQSIPVGSFTLANSVYSFKSLKIASGITQFYFNQKTGAFFLTLKAIPAEGNDPSGMALSSDIVTRADMAVSVDLALDAGVELQGSGYLRLTRNDITKKKWFLR